MVGQPPAMTAGSLQAMPPVGSTFATVPQRRETWGTWRPWVVGKAMETSRTNWRSHHPKTGFG